MTTVASMADLMDFTPKVDLKKSGSEIRNSSLIYTLTVKARVFYGGLDKFGKRSCSVKPYPIMWTNLESLKNELSKLQVHNPEAAVRSVVELEIVPGIDSVTYVDGVSMVAAKMKEMFGEFATIDITRPITAAFFANVSQGFRQMLRQVVVEQNLEAIGQAYIHICSSDSFAAMFHLRHLTIRGATFTVKIHDSGHYRLNMPPLLQTLTVTDCRVESPHAKRSVMFSDATKVRLVFLIAGAEHVELLRNGEKKQRFAAQFLKPVYPTCLGASNIRELNIDFGAISAHPFDTNAYAWDFMPRLKRLCVSMTAESSLSLENTLRNWNFLCKILFQKRPSGFEQVIITFPDALTNTALQSYDLMYDHLQRHVHRCLKERCSRILVLEQVAIRAPFRFMVGLCSIFACKDTKLQITLDVPTAPKIDMTHFTFAQQCMVHAASEYDELAIENARLFWNSVPPSDDELACKEIEEALATKYNRQRQPTKLFGLEEKKE
jgi:hypothetical protein